MSRNGILIAHYERDGDIKTGGLPLETPSDRETARQKRMEREE